jgi:hypothetical protein
MNNERTIMVEVPSKQDYDVLVMRVATLERVVEERLKQQEPPIDPEELWGTTDCMKYLSTRLLKSDGSARIATVMGMKGWLERNGLKPDPSSGTGKFFWRAGDVLNALEYSKKSIAEKVALDLDHYRERKAV